MPWNVPNDSSSILVVLAQGFPGCQGRCSRHVGHRLECIVAVLSNQTDDFVVGWDTMRSFVHVFLSNLISLRNNGKLIETIVFATLEVFAINFQFAFGNILFLLTIIYVTLRRIYCSNVILFLNWGYATEFIEKKPEGKYYFSEKYTISYHAIEMRGSWYIFFTLKSTISPHPLNLNCCLNVLMSIEA